MENQEFDFCEKQDFLVVKEKLIKTDVLLRLFKEKADRLSKASQAFKQLKSKYDNTMSELQRLEMANERLNTTLLSIKPKHEQNEKELFELRADRKMLENKYSQSLIDSQNSIKNLEDQIKECICRKNVSTTPTKKRKTEEKIKEIKIECRELREAEQKLKKENAILTLKTKELENHKSQNVNIVSNLCKTNETLEADIKMLKVKMKEMEKVSQENAYLQQEIVSLKENHDLELESLKNKLLRLSNENRIMDGLKLECNNLKNQNLNNNNKGKDASVQTDLINLDIPSTNVGHTKNNQNNFDLKQQFYEMQEKLKHFESKIHKQDKMVQTETPNNLDFAVQTDLINLNIIEKSNENKFANNEENILGTNHYLKQESCVSQEKVICFETEIQKKNNTLQTETGNENNYIFSDDDSISVSSIFKEMIFTKVLTPLDSSIPPASPRNNADLLEELDQMDDHNFEEELDTPYTSSPIPNIIITPPTPIIEKNNIQEPTFSINQQMHSLNMLPKETNTNDGLITITPNIMNGDENYESEISTKINETDSIGSKNTYQAEDGEKPKFDKKTSYQVSSKARKIRRYNFWTPYNMPSFVKVPNKQRRKLSKIGKIQNNQILPQQDTILKALQTLQENNINFTISNESIPNPYTYNAYKMNIQPKKEEKIALPSLRIDQHESMDCWSQKCKENSMQMVLRSLPSDEEPQLLGFYNKRNSVCFSNCNTSQVSAKPEVSSLIAESLVDKLLNGLKELITEKHKENTGFYKRSKSRKTRYSEFRSETETELERLFRNSSDILQRNRKLLETARQQNANYTIESNMESDYEMMVDSGLVTATPKMDTDSYSLKSNEASNIQGYESSGSEKSDTCLIVRDSLINATSILQGDSWQTNNLTLGHSSLACDKIQISTEKTELSDSLLLPKCSPNKMFKITELKSRLAESFNDSNKTNKELATQIDEFDKKSQIDPRPLLMFNNKLDLGVENVHHSSYLEYFKTPPKIPPDIQCHKSNERCIDSLYFKPNETVLFDGPVISINNSNVSIPNQNTETNNDFTSTDIFKTPKSAVLENYQNSPQYISLLSCPKLVSPLAPSVGSPSKVLEESPGFKYIMENRSCKNKETNDLNITQSINKENQNYRSPSATVCQKLTFDFNDNTGQSNPIAANQNLKLPAVHLEHSKHIAQPDKLIKAVCSDTQPNKTTNNFVPTDISLQTYSAPLNTPLNSNESINLDCFIDNEKSIQKPTELSSQFEHEHTSSSTGTQKYLTKRSIESFKKCIKDKLNTSFGKNLETSVLRVTRSSKRKSEDTLEVLVKSDEKITPKDGVKKKRGCPPKKQNQRVEHSKSDEDIPLAQLKENIIKKETEDDSIEKNSFDDGIQTNVENLALSKENDTDVHTNNKIEADLEVNNGRELNENKYQENEIFQNKSVDTNERQLADNRKKCIGQINNETHQQTGEKCVSMETNNLDNSAFNMSEVFSKQARDKSTTKKFISKEFVSDPESESDVNKTSNTNKVSVHNNLENHSSTDISKLISDNDSSLNQIKQILNDFNKSSVKKINGISAKQSCPSEIEIFGETISDSDDETQRSRRDSFIAKKGSSLKKQILHQVKGTVYDFSKNAKKSSFKNCVQNQKARIKAGIRTKKINVVQDILISSRQTVNQFSQNQKTMSQTHVADQPPSEDVLKSRSGTTISRTKNKFEKKISNNTQIDILSEVMAEMAKTRPRLSASKNILPKPIAAHSSQFVSIENQAFRLESNGKEKIDVYTNEVLAKEQFNVDVTHDNFDCPKSPDPVEADKLPQLPKLIPTEKPVKFQGNKVKKLMDKLMVYSHEEKVLDDVIHEFAFQDTNYMARIILSKVSLDYHDKADNTFAPSPALTPTQRILLGFISKLDRATHPGIINEFLSIAEKELFRIPRCEFEAIKPITRLYTAILKLRRNLNRMRRFVCEGFYFMGDFAVPMFFTVLTMWPEVLPMQTECLEFLTGKVWVQLCYLKSCNQPGYELMPLRDLLQKYYGYPNERWKCDDIFQEIFIEYLRNPSIRISDLNLLLFLKNKPTKWVHEKIRDNIIPVYEAIADENVNLKATLIILIGNICCAFKSVEDYDWSVILEVNKWFQDLDIKDPDPIVQRSINLAMARLPKKRKTKKKKCKLNKDTEGCKNSLEDCKKERIDESCDKNNQSHNVNIESLTKSDDNLDKTEIDVSVNMDSDIVF